MFKLSYQWAPSCLFGQKANIQLAIETANKLTTRVSLFDRYETVWASHDETLVNELF
jgi:hypothetical protein